MDYSLENHASYIGRPVSELPTPALVLSKPVLEHNTRILLEDVKELGIKFRPHVKTLKCTEVTRMMLGNTHRGIVASTLAEIRGSLELVKSGELDECLYGLPVSASALPFLETLTKSLKIILMIDSEQQIDLLESYLTKSPSVSPWPVFIKIDVGSKRAGLVTDSPSLPKLIHRIESSPAASVYGFYCHAGHSYACRTEDAAAAVLQSEIEGVVQASKYLLDKDRKIVVSVGSTPTAHVIKRLQGVLPEGMDLELHAGNYPTNDLQQVATSLVTPTQQAVRILADVCSVYPERNEALINAGTVALAKETSEFPGFGIVADRPGWSVVRMAQEHGILGLKSSEQTERIAGIMGVEVNESERVESSFKVGDKVLLYIQHACITAAMHFAYYVVDEEDIVRETWVPWKGW